MKKKTILWLILPIMVLAVTLISACTETTPTPSPTPIPTPAPALSASVTGTVTYLEKIALPPNAIINVKLQDISKADAPAVTIGELSITASGKQVPFNFEITYDPATIDPRFTYAVRGTITIDGQLTFTSDKNYPVITRGNPISAEIILKKVSAPTPGLTLENTAWVLQSYGQSGNLKSVLKDAEVTALFDSAKAQVAGSAGVNRYVGGYELKGNNLSIPKMLATTAMAGPQPLMDQEKEYLTALQAAESYKIEGDKLTITCGGKVLIFRSK